MAVTNAGKNYGLLSRDSEFRAEKDKHDYALRELQIAKDEELAEYDAGWFSTLWKAYTEFGPSMDSPHGHDCFLAPCNETFLTAGPLSPEIARMAAK